MLCESCQDNINSEYSCEICNSKLCQECYQSKEIYLEEWCSIDKTCESCQKTGCANCINTCLNCANVGDSKVLCDNCSDWNYLNCEYHVWNVCDDCYIELDNGNHCPECRTNKNYHRYNF